MGAFREVFSLLKPAQFVLWIVFFLLFSFGLALSTRAPITYYFSPFSYIHLMLLFILMFLQSGKIPLWLLMLFGVFIDSLHAQWLGSSSLLLMIIFPLIQLFVHSGARYSSAKVCFIFSLSLAFYLLGQTFIQGVLRGLYFDLFIIMVDYLVAIILFPLVYAAVVLPIKRYSRSGMTPL